MTVEEIFNTKMRETDRLELLRQRFGEQFSQRDMWLLGAQFDHDDPRIVERDGGPGGSGGPGGPGER